MLTPVLLIIISATSLLYDLEIQSFILKVKYDKYKNDYVVYISFLKYIIND